MRTKAYQNYLDAEIQSASPVRLVQLLFRGCIDAIASARTHLRSGDIRARSRSISKAMAIVTQLSMVLNHEKGGELSQNLAELYAYSVTLLIRANTEQIDPPLAEAERLLSTISEGWNGVTADAQNPANFTNDPPPQTAARGPVGYAL